jgi:hypothetical protein
MTEQGPEPEPGTKYKIISVSEMAKTRFDSYQRILAAELGRRVTQTEALEQLLAGQWGEKP